MTTVHVIPFDDEQSEQKSKRIKLNSSASPLASIVPPVASLFASYVPDGPIRGTTLFEDSLLAFEDVISLTNTIGSSIVLHEAFQVNNRVVDYQQRMTATVNNSNRSNSNQQQQLQENNRHRKRSLEGKAPDAEDDEMATESNDTFDEECSEGKGNVANVVAVQEKKGMEEDVQSLRQRLHDDDVKERRSILRQACRMKRVTNLFRNLNRLQTMIVHEIHSCMIDTAVHEVQLQPVAPNAASNSSN
jgi:hypothetical protein